MARPKHEHPTPGELEVLNVLWDRGPCSVRQVMEALNRRRRRAYTSVMSLLGVMTEKGLLKRKLRGRGYLYEPRVDREKTVGQMLQDLLSRAFEGSATCLVASLLDETCPSQRELEEIRDTIDRFHQGALQAHCEGDSPIFSSRKSGQSPSCHRQTRGED